MPFDQPIVDFAISQWQTKLLCPCMQGAL